MVSKSELNSVFCLWHRVSLYPLQSAAGTQLLIMVVRYFEYE